MGAVLGVSVFPLLHIGHIRRCLLSAIGPLVGGIRVRVPRRTFWLVLVGRTLCTATGSSLPRCLV
eukprot:SAG25_NODE_7088_length_506_cov_0.761671_1_plen_64_part_01